MPLHLSVLASLANQKITFEFVFSFPQSMQKYSNKRLVELADIEKIHQQNFDTLAGKICDFQNQNHQPE